eukprot:6522254-Lingulodinium_polyedra.AAC.1
MPDDMTRPQHNTFARPSVELPQQKPAPRRQTASRQQEAVPRQQTTCPYRGAASYRGKENKWRIR